MSEIETLTVEGLLERHKTACEFKQRVDKEAIEKYLRTWITHIYGSPLRVRFLQNEHEVQQSARGARAAGAARAARDARAARAAGAARDAWAAWAARAARDAWAAWAARAARDAWDAWDASWVSCTAIGALQLNNVDQFVTWYPLLQALESGCWFFFITEDEIVVSTIPDCVMVDNDNRLHSENDAAFKWLNVESYYWHGVEVPKGVIVNPDGITVEHIHKERNAEVRRVMLTRYGEARYIENSHIEPVAQDEYGTVYIHTMIEDEPLVMVRVVNSTPESDGSYKPYWLRVDPNAYQRKTRSVPQAAVASTWRDEDGGLFFVDYRDYVLQQQT